MLDLDLDLDLDLGLGDLRWPKRPVSVPSAATTPLGTTTGCGPVRAARPSSRGASKVGRQSAMS